MRKKSRRPRSSEAGQILIFTGLGMVILLGFAALAVDIGFFAHTKREVQNDADAMALAGVRELTARDLSESAREAIAEDVAEEWGTKNGVDAGEITDIDFDATCSSGSVEDIITVRLARPQNTFLAGVLGVSSATLNVCATARTGLARGGPGMLPIGILQEDPAVSGVCYYEDSDFWYDHDDGSDLSANGDVYAEGGEDERCIVKVANPRNDNTWAPGHTGPLRLDDPSNDVDPDNYDADCDEENNSGAADYGENIEDGSECSYAVNDWLRPLPGAHVGQTCSNFNDRLENHRNSDASHVDHDIEDVFHEPVMVDGVHVYTRVDTTNPHFGILPVITPPAGGTSVDTKIVTFVTVYLVGCGVATNSPGPNDDEYIVTVIPVNSQYFVAGQEIVEPGDEDYLTDWPAFTIKLID